MRSLRGKSATFVRVWVALAAALHFYYAGFGFPEPMELAALHLMLFVPPVFLLYPLASRDENDQPKWFDWGLALLAFLPSLYIYLNTHEIYERSTYITALTPLQFGLGVVMIVMTLEAVRRALSWVLAALAGIGLLYMMICHLLPGVWHYRNMPMMQIVETQYFMVDSGLYGSLTRISATLITTFLIFGAFMQASGMGRFFNNLGAMFAGRYSAGPAKVCVVSSGLFGTMSGSSVANVVVSGQITIPMMHKIGFKPTVAAAIEASSSVGGPMVPPVMGAAAFIMAETTGIPYPQIIIGASLIAVIYFAANLINVHLEGRRLGIGPTPEEDMPTWKDLLDDAHLMIPITMLTVMMIMQFSPYIAAFYSTVATVAVAALRKHTRMNLAAMWEALVDAGRTVCLLAAAVAAAGMITAALTNTGLVLALSGIISSLAGGSFTMLVLLIAVTCLIMGMGVPTTPAYIITAAIGAPLLAQHGVPLLNAHLFVFYFAVLADVTPPVAGATYAAAAIIKAPPIASGFQAMRFSIGGFLCGIAVAFDPALTLDGSLLDIVSITVAIMVGITLISGGIIGYLFAPLPLWLRPIMIGGGLLLGLAHEIPSWERAIVGVLIFAPLWLLIRWLDERSTSTRKLAGGV